MDANKERTAQAGGVSRPQRDDHEDHFGVLTVHVKEGQGHLTLPKDIPLSVLRDLQAALLAGLEYSFGVVLEWSEVSRCDVFFCQLLLVARRSYAKHSKKLMCAGPLPEDLRKACQTQGFEGDGANGILPQTLPA
jgi:hypothetical protein